ncbi:MAG: hypothetical protein COA78_29625 [Blastopirellula sp.]|nr:MAG: hypothetical protein COA78_29625 [Blastopirellula sp.]
MIDIGLKISQKWSPGKKAADSLLSSSIAGLSSCSKSVCDETVTSAQPLHSVYLTRLWTCWSHHWAQAAETEQIEGCQVAKHIQNGRGYRKGGNLGGDPLRDVVLAVAITNKANRAAEQFEADYFEYAKKLSGKVNTRFPNDTDDWWNEFLDYLAGYTKPSGKLDRFEGKCALKNWLGTVLWNFLRRRPLPEGASRNEHSATTVDQASEDIDRMECVGLFREIIEAALADLTPQERLLLAWLYIDGLQGNQAAAILGVHPGTVVHRRDRALLRLREFTVKHAESKQKRASFQDCLEQIPGSQTDYATALIEALKQQRGEG